MITRTFDKCFITFVCVYTSQYFKYIEYLESGGKIKNIEYYLQFIWSLEETLKILNIWSLEE